MPVTPAGVVTFLLTDVEGSSRQWEARPGTMRNAIAVHDRLVAGGVERHGGRVLTSHGEGDSFFAVFATPGDAIAAAAAIQRSLASQSWPDGLPLRVRMAIRTGPAEPPDYRGPTANRCARLRACAHGGQVLLSSASAEQREAMPTGATLLDLGEHRLRDMSRPERIYQLALEGLRTEFPPLSSLGAFSHNLPVQLTSFVGRARDVADVKRLLSRSRIVTLTGPAGCGKSRLALQVAAESLEAYPGGVWFVGLAQLADAGSVPYAAAAALGVREEAGQPLLATLGGRLRERPVLLLLDNCEHLVAPCTELVRSLLGVCPELQVLATSREFLHLPGEAARTVRPLALPDPRRPPAALLGESEAVALLLDRVTSLRPGFRLTPRNAEAVAQIVRRLEGIPLAIELAAPHLRAASAGEVLERLRDRFGLLAARGRAGPSRHRTLRAAIDWSHELLEPLERTLFRRLAVFAGGWSLEAAESVCSGAPIGPDQVLDLLGRLVDKSIVIPVDEGEVTRYAMLDTLRDYGAERLTGSAEGGALSQRHLDHFLATAERMDVALTGEPVPDALRRLAADYDNLVVALRAARDRGPEVLLRFTRALAWFWAAGFRPGEGRRWLREALDASTEPTWSRAHALKGLASLEWQQRDNAAAAALLDEAIRLFALVGDERRVASCHTNLGLVAFSQGQYERANSHYAASLTILRRLESPRALAILLADLGLMNTDAGLLDAGRENLEESLSILRELDDRRLLPQGLAHCGLNAVYRGDLDSARTLCAESLELARALGDGIAIVEGLEAWALLAAAEGGEERAIRLAAAAAALRRDLEAPASDATARRRDRWLTPLRDAAGRVAFDAAWQHGSRLSMDEAIAHALTGASDPGTAV